MLRSQKRGGLPLLATVIFLAVFLITGALSEVQRVFAAEWGNVGEEGFSAGGNTAYLSLVFNPSTNEPYVAYEDGGNSNKATVMKYSGSSWQTVGSEGFSAGDAFTLSLAFNPSTNEPYVAFEDKGNSWKATVMKYSGGSWQSVGGAGFSDGAGYYTSLAFNPLTNEPYVAYEDGGNSNKATVKKFIREQVAAPTASPAGGSYTSNQSVSLSTTTSGATIHYTTDGSTPTSSSATYSSSLSISGATTLKAIAVKSGMTDSGVMSESYNVQVTTDTSTLTFSSSKKAKKNITFTFKDLLLTNKKYVNVRLNGRKVKTVRVRRIGNDSLVTVTLKYGRWATGNYNLAMSYKNQIKIPYTTKKGETKYRKGWESGSVNSENILSII